MNDRLKWRMWSTHAGRYFDENNDAMLQNVFECMKQQICYDCQNPVLRKIYDRIAYNHIEDGMVFEQCTGLKDKNGTLIYEGDILKSIYSEIMKYRIYWEGRGYRMRVYGSDNKIVDDCPIFTNAADVLEVIGNIHENADLLENE